MMFPPPPVQGLGTTGGFKLHLEDRASLGYEALDAATKAFLMKAYQTPELAGIFHGINAPFKATRYHSLVVERASLPHELTVTAETGDRLIMGLAHRTLPVHGVQFHPESIASEYGHLMLRNFLDIAAVWNAAGGRQPTGARASRRVS